MNSVVVQTAIGLVFVFAVFSVFVSIITEAISRFIGLRGEYLLRGLRTMVDSNNTFEMKFWRGGWFRRADEIVEGEPEPACVTQLLEHPLIKASAGGGAMPEQAGNRKLSAKSRRNLPAYISAHTFAQALLDTLVPDHHGKTAMTMVRKRIDELPENNALRRPLSALAKEAENDLTAFRTSIEAWYDAHMDRVSGWYKRHTRWISLGIGAVLVVLFNLNVFAIGRELYTDQGVRAAVVRQAAHATQCHAKSPQTCLGDVEQSLNNAELAGLPIGWHTVTTCAPTAHKNSSDKCTNVFERTGLIGAGFSFWHNVGVFLLVLAGWLLMVIALLPGARFWFDLLGRLGSLRSTGPKPAKASAASAS